MFSAILTDSHFWVVGLQFIVTRRELGDTYVDDLFNLYKGRVKAESDLVVYWFEKARAQVEAGKTRRVGLLATQSIRGGANRNVLERIQETGNIFWAWSDRPWLLEGAAVRVSMVGFDSGDEIGFTLNGSTTSAIHTNLTSDTDVTRALRLKENENLCFMGSSKVGAFDIAPETARKLLQAPLNPNGRPNSDVVRPWVNAIDVTRRPRGMYIIDFDPELSEKDAALYELPFEYVKQHVYPKRSLNRRELYATKWWTHGEARPELRSAIAGLSRFIVTTRVSSHRVFIWTPAGTLPDSATFVFARDDDYFFGVLHSLSHEIWALSQGSHLEDRFRYTPNSTFDTFPLPWRPGEEPTERSSPQVEAISHASRELVRLRDAWLNPDGASADDLKLRTLTNLYNQRPQWLIDAHAALNTAVQAAYGWPENLSKQDMLTRLLALNETRAAADSDVLNG